MDRILCPLVALMLSMSVSVCPMVFIDSANNAAYCMSRECLECSSNAQKSKRRERQVSLEFDGRRYSVICDTCGFLVNGVDFENALAVFTNHDRTHRARMIVAEDPHEYGGST